MTSSQMNSEAQQINDWDCLLILTLANYDTASKGWSMISDFNFAYLCVLCGKK